MICVYTDVRERLFKRNVNKNFLFPEIDKSTVTVGFNIKPQTRAVMEDPLRVLGTKLTRLWLQVESK